jgi:PAS domain S-box-containing protein
MENLKKEEGVIVELTEAVLENKKLLDLQAAVLEHLPDAVVVIDEDGNIVLVNAQTELVFGYYRLELKGKKLEVLLPDKYKKVHAEVHRVDYINRPRIRAMGYNLPLFGRRKNGSEFACEIMLAPVITPTGIYTVAILRRTRTEEDNKHDYNLVMQKVHPEAELPKTDLPKSESPKTPPPKTPPSKE